MGRGGRGSPLKRDRRIFRLQTACTLKSRCFTPVSSVNISSIIFVCLSSFKEWDSTSKLSQRGLSGENLGSTVNLHYRQSSSMKYLFSNWDRTETEQVSDTRSKGTMNSIFRVSIAEARTYYLEPLSLPLLFLGQSICLHLFMSVCVCFFRGLYITNDKLRDCILLIDLSIKPS